MDRGPSLLNNVYNKSVHGFYDRFDRPDSRIAPIQYRNYSNLVTAACFIFHILGEKPLNRKTMLSYAKSPSGIERKYSYPRIAYRNSAGSNQRKALYYFLKLIRI